jgi:hypothetical protein
VAVSFIGGYGPWSYIYIFSFLSISTMTCYLEITPVSLIYIHYIGISSKMSAHTLKKHAVHNLQRLAWGPWASVLRAQMGMR